MSTALVLVGPQGSGKSVLAHKLAAGLGRLLHCEAWQLSAAIRAGALAGQEAVIVDGFPIEPETLSQIAERLPRQQFIFCLDSAEKALVDLAASAPFPTRMRRVGERHDEPCCANERRGMNGGCSNCGDPCF